MTKLELLEQKKSSLAPSASNPSKKGKHSSQRADSFPKKQITYRKLSFVSQRDPFPSEYEIVGVEAIKHKLIYNDTLSKNAIPKETANLIITSPPYNVGKNYGTLNDSISYQDYLSFTKTWLENCYYWSHPNGRICINVALDKNRHGKAPLSADVTKIAMEVGWKYHATIIWNEGNISRRTAWGSWLSASAPHVIAPVETILVLYKDEWRRGKVGESDIEAEEFKEWVFGMWTFNGENGKRLKHEAPFPRELPKRCIKLFSFKGDTILDPFSGSGTTMIEAIHNGRRALGIELSQEYCALSIERIIKECESCKVLPKI